MPTPTHLPTSSFSLLLLLFIPSFLHWSSPVVLAVRPRERETDWEKEWNREWERFWDWERWSKDRGLTRETAESEKSRPAEELGEENRESHLLLQPYSSSSVPAALHASQQLHFSFLLFSSLPLHHTISSSWPAAASRTAARHVLHQQTSITPADHREFPSPANHEQQTERQRERDTRERDVVAMR